MSRCERKLHVEPAPDAGQFRLKVAFATQDRVTVNQHFGTAKSLMVFGVGTEGWSLLEVIEFPSSLKQTHDKLPSRIHELAGCAAVYCNACGVSAIRKLVEQGVNPVKVPEGINIHELLKEIQFELNHFPKGWLARALKQGQRKDEKRFDRLLDDTW